MSNKIAKLVQYNSLDLCMRKLLTLLSLPLSFLVCSGTSKSVEVSFEDIRDNWKNKAITVNKGGEAPHVIDFLRSFNEVWRTDAADSLILAAGDRLYVGYDDETVVSGNIYVDCEDFNCAWYNHGDTGDMAIETRTYYRENGHTLFVVSLERSNPEQTTFCCFYDYDPVTSVMTPEEEPYSDLKPRYKDSGFRYMVAREDYVQDIIVLEIPREGKTFYHYYTYDGMRHSFSFSSDELVDPEMDDEE